MLNTEYIETVTKGYHDNELGKYSMAEKRDVLATVVGYAIGVKTQLPPTEVTDVLSYYMDKYDLPVLSLLDKINQKYFINIELAKMVAKQVYMMRYNLVYSIDNVIQFTPVLEAGGLISIPPLAKKTMEMMGVSELAKVEKYFY